MTSRNSAVAIKRLAAAQVALGLVVLAVTVAIPTPGQAALYLPLFGGAARAVSFAAREHASVLARGPIAGSLVLRAPSRGLFLAALADRAFVIATPPVGCEPNAQTSNRT